MTVRNSTLQNNKSANKFLFILLLFTACKLPQSVDKKSVIECENKLKKEIINNWKLLEDLKYYKTNLNFIDSITFRYHLCLSHFSERDIIVYFGKPNQISIDPEYSMYIKSIKYLITPPCSKYEKNGYDCTYLIFQLNSNDSIVNIIKQRKLVNIVE